MNASELCYYCPDCDKFHYSKDNTVVNEKLCFVCDKKKTRKAHKLHMGDDSIQVCDSCAKEKLELSEEEIKLYSRKPYLPSISLH